MVTIEVSLPFKIHLPFPPRLSPVFDFDLFLLVVGEEIDANECAESPWSWIIDHLGPRSAKV